MFYAAKRITVLPIEQTHLGNAGSDTVTSDLSSLTTCIIWFGGFAKDEATTGDLYVDEIVIGTSYIGPVVVDPVSSFADDPRRWLVIYNTAVSDSVTWADSYRDKRGIPYANLCGLNLPTTETIDGSQYSAMRLGIAGYLDDNHLDGHVLGLLIGYGVPGYADLGGQGDIDAVSDLLHSNSTDAIAASNPLAAAQNLARPSLANLEGFRLTSRIDAPSLAQADALADRADVLMANGLGDGVMSTLWLDPYTAPGPLTDPLIAQMSSWASSGAAMQTRLPIALSAESDPQQEVEFTSVSNDGFFWGWSAQTPPSAFFSAPIGARIFCFQLHPDHATGGTLRSATPANWMDTAVDAGYASVAGSSDSYSLTAVPDVARFFESIRLGWTVAEAWFVACPILREALFLAGDPLLQVTLPKSGVDLFGPSSTPESIDLDLPLATLRDADSTHIISAEDRPADGESAYYLAYRVDDSGRRDGTGRLTHIARISDNSHPTVRTPIWPTESEWPVRIQDSQAYPVVVWERPLDAVVYSSIALEAQINGGPTQSLQSLAVVPNQLVYEFTHNLEDDIVRFRFRINTANGIVHETPWSITITPPSPTLSNLEHF